MARKPSAPGMRDRAAKTAAAMAGGPSAVQAQDKKPGLLASLRNTPKFIKEVRAEARKITWTSRRETWITSVMVAIMVTLAAIFFMSVDFVVSKGMEVILSFAAGG